MRKILYILLLTTSYSFGQSSASPYTVAQWASNGETEWTRSETKFLDQTSSNQAGSQPRYYDFRIIDPNIALFQSTGDFMYLDRAITYIDRIKGLATQSNSGLTWNDGYYDWVYNGGQFQLYDGHGLRNIFKLLWIMKKYPAIRSTARPGGGTYQDKYDEYLPWFTTNVYDKWLSRSCRWILRGNSWMASHIGSNMALYLYLLDDNQAKKDEYLAWVDAWNNDTGNACSHSSLVAGVGFRDILRTGTHGGYVYNGNWTSHPSTGFSDMSHANAGVQSVINQHLLGIEWTDTDINKFITTLNAVLDASPTSDYSEIPEYMNAVYNSSDDNRSYLVYGWSRLGAFDVTLYNRLHDLRVDPSTYYGYNLAGQMAYNKAYIDGTMVYPEYVVTPAGDTTAPTISGFSITDINTTEFRTRINPYDATKVAVESATVQSRYGTATGTYTKTGALATSLTSHNYRFGHPTSDPNGALTPGTQYFFQFQLIDEAGNGAGAWSSEYTHTTLGTPPPTSAISIRRIKLGSQRLRIIF